jgi:hypothetical protein
LSEEAVRLSKENAMQKKEKKQVTVVSKCDVYDGARVVYRGMRFERAWSWIWKEDLPDRRPTSGVTSGVTQRIHVLIAESNLSQYDKKQCRRSLARMNAKQLGQLEAALRNYQPRKGLQVR